MVKTITIGGTPLDMQSSLHFAYVYKRETGKELLTEITNLNSVDESETMGMLDRVLRIAYLMNIEYTCKPVDFEEWTRIIGDGVLDDKEWINEVINLALVPFLKQGLAQKQ